MKNIIIRFLVTILTIFGFSPAVFAADANLTFASSVTSGQIGSEIKVTVNASISGFNAASTTFKVLYDANMLEYQTHSGSGSGFPLEFSEPTVSNGEITHSRGKTGSGVTGNVKVVEYTFKAKNNGSTTVRFGASQIWEAGTGTEKSVDTGATLNLSFSSSSSSSSSSSGSSSSSTPTPTPAPKVTAKPATPRPTATPTAKPTTSATATATPTPTATPATGGASPLQSTVTMSATTAVANGTDKIDVNVIVRDESGAILTNVEPSFFGLREGDTATAFTFDAVTQSWSAALSSTTAGTLFLNVSAGGTDIANQDITFTTATSPAPAQTTGSSFTTIILVGFLILLILLLILFFIWRRLKSHNDDEDQGNGPDAGAAFPGDESQQVDAVTKPEPVSPPPTDVMEDANAKLNQDAILQRGGPPPAAATEEKPANDDTIPI